MFEWLSYGLSGYLSNYFTKRSAIHSRNRRRFKDLSSPRCRLSHDRTTELLFLRCQTMEQPFKGSSGYQGYKKTSRKYYLTLYLINGIGIIGFLFFIMIMNYDCKYCRDSQLCLKGPVKGDPIKFMYICMYKQPLKPLNKGFQKWLQLLWRILIMLEGEFSFHGQLCHYGLLNQDSTSVSKKSSSSVRASAVGDK